MQASGLLESSPLRHAFPQGALGTLGDIQILHGTKSCSSSQQRAGGKSPRRARGDYLLSGTRHGGGAVPVDSSVSRNEAQQSCGVMCVCLQGPGGQMAAVAPVLSTCCPKRFLGYIIPVPEKLESLPPLLHKCMRKQHSTICKAVILGNREVRRVWYLAVYVRG